jgi:hypothetical protein
MEDNDINFSEINKIIKLYDISIANTLPNNNLFDSEYHEIILFNKNYIKSTYKTSTNEKFYKNGFIENTFFNNKDDEKNSIQKFSKKICYYNWLLSFNIFLHYTNNKKLDFIKNNNIRLLNMGNGKGDFITGMYYYYYTSNISKKIPKLSNFNINWAGIDINNKSSNSNYCKFSDLLKKYINPECYDIIHFESNDDILEYKNFIDLKNTIDNVNIIYNNIKPLADGKKNKIMLSVAILSIYTLDNNGIMITKILEPEYWDGSYIDYIILFSLIFTKTDIFRFPIYKKNKIYYRYYLIGCCKKNLIYNTIMGRKLMFLLYKNDIINPRLLSSIVECAEIDELKNKLNNIKNNYLSDIESPKVELHNNINSLKYFL